MRAPDSLPAAWRAAWRTHTAVLAERGWRPETDAALLERMLLHRAAAVDALEAAQASPWIPGSAGQLTAHPGFAVAARCESVALALAKQLDLGPLGRRLAGVAPADEPADEFADLDDELAKRRGARGVS